MYWAHASSELKWRERVEQTPRREYKSLIKRIGMLRSTGYSKWDAYSPSTRAAMEAKAEENGACATDIKINNGLRF